MLSPRLQKAAKLLVLIVLAAFFVLTLLIGALVVSAYRDNRAATGAAEAFCSVPAGADLDGLIAKAEQKGIRYWHDERNSLHEFQFPAFMLNAAFCEVKTSDGKVVSTRTFFLRD